MEDSMTNDKFLDLVQPMGKDDGRLGKLIAELSKNTSEAVGEIKITSTTEVININ